MIGWVRTIVDCLSLFVVISGFTFGLTNFGLRRTLPSAIAACLIVIFIELVGQDIAERPYVAEVIVIFSAVMGGLFFGLYVSKSDQRPFFLSFRSRSYEIISDKRVLILLVASCVAILMTFEFAQLQKFELNHGFWHGFYEAWTASIVFFLILGVAGTVVAFYRPEKEELFTRVSILCGGRRGSTVNFITGKIREIGYYTEEIRRSYQIINYDPIRCAYEVEMSLSSSLRNFYDEVQEDNVKFKLTSDVFDPPLPEDKIGILHSVVIDGADSPPPEIINTGIFERNWKIKIPKTRSSTLSLKYQSWLAAKDKHRVKASRFTVKARMDFTYVRPDHVPTLVVNMFKRVNPHIPSDNTLEKFYEKTLTMEPGRTEFMPEAENCHPGDMFIEFELRPPVSEPPEIAIENK